MLLGAAGTQQPDCVLVPDASGHLVDSYFPSLTARSFAAPGGEEPVEIRTHECVTAANTHLLDSPDVREVSDGKVPMEARWLQVPYLPSKLNLR
jgi:hypothetical protein